MATRTTGHTRLDGSFEITPLPSQARSRDPSVQDTVGVPNELTTGLVSTNQGLVWG